MDLEALTRSSIPKLLLAQAKSQNPAVLSMRDLWFLSMSIPSAYFNFDVGNFLTSTQFLVNPAIWEYECEANEPFSEEMGEMDEKCPIGLEMFRTTMCRWSAGSVDSNQRN